MKDLWKSEHNYPPFEFVRKTQVESKLRHQPVKAGLCVRQRKDLVCCVLHKKEKETSSVKFARIVQAPLQIGECNLSDA